MKKFMMVVCCLGVFMLSGCDEILGDDELDYAKFSSAVSSPTSSTAADYSGKTVEFAAMVLTDVDKMQSDDKGIDGNNYIAVCISRNIDHIIYVNVQDVKKVPAPGTVVTVKGKVDGYIYSTGEDGKQESLNILAKSVEKRNVDEVKVSKKDTYKSVSGDETYTFKKAQAFQDAMGESKIILYYDVKIGNDVIVPAVRPSELFAFQGDKEISRGFSTLIPDGVVDPTALDASIEMLNEGEKAYAYVVYEELLDATTPITLVAYDDEFNVIYEYTMNIE